jgi:hypothetical protein
MKKMCALINVEQNFESLLIRVADADPLGSWIRIRITVESWSWIRILIKVKIKNLWRLKMAVDAHNGGLEAQNRALEGL